MTQGVVVWVTGLPSAGKSTFARKLAHELGVAGVATCVLDGDEVRKAVAPTLGYGEDERAAFYESLARLAALVAGQGFAVLVPATAHLRRFRERARELWPAFVEVWVDTALEECARRDSKGLYARASARGVDALPGLGVDYEEPRAADHVARGGEDGAALAAVLERVRREAGRTPER